MADPLPESKHPPASFFLFCKHCAMHRRRGTTGGIGALRLRRPLPSDAATSAQGDRK